jgi:hypothetical protein
MKPMSSAPTAPPHPIQTIDTMQEKRKQMHCNYQQLCMHQQIFLCLLVFHPIAIIHPLEDQNQTIDFFILHQPSRRQTKKTTTSFSHTAKKNAVFGT